MALCSGAGGSADMAEDRVCSMYGSCSSCSVALVVSRYGYGLVVADVGASPPSLVMASSRVNAIA
jgi:hypothetical protein